MKKLLLSLATVALTASMSWANETALTFDGEGDVAGLTRITDTATPTAQDCVKDFSFIQDDVTCSFTTDLEIYDSSIDKIQQSTGPGFALFTNTNPAKPNESGIYISSYVNTQISLSVPGGKITSVKLILSGYSVATLSVDANGEKLEPQDEPNNIYSYSWANTEGVETVNMQFLRTFMPRYVHAIEVTYTPDLGGKSECGLAFSQKSVEAIIGEKNSFPVLSNPNKLPVSWSSSDESIATVDASGKITLIKGGKTTISASTDGNASYAAGNSKYVLSVIPAANNLLQMKELAPTVYSKVYVKCPLTVTFANLGYAFVLDSDGNAGYIYNKKNEGSTATSASTIYKVGDIIPANWMATNATIYESLMWEGIPAEVTETTKVTYPLVSAVTTEDTDRVVTLKEVTFTTSTPSGNTKAYGTTPDGTRYEFQDTYDIPQRPAGTYNVTGAVRYAKVGSTAYFYIAPIAYSDPTAEVDPIFPDSFDVTISCEGLEVKQADQGYPYTFNVTGVCDKDNITVKLAVPEDWDGFIAAKENEIMDGPMPNSIASRAEDEIDWTPIQPMISMGFKKSNELEFAADDKLQIGQFYLYKGDQVANKPIYVNVKVAGNGAGVGSIEDAASAARYFNLQGIETANPENGIFIKVTEGKSTKITIK